MTGLPCQLAPWRATPDLIEQRLTCRQPAQAIRAVCVVHNETSTGVTSPTSPPCGASIDAAKHPALLMVDTISGLASSRLPPRRLGRRRGGQRFAEGPDAAAGHQLQCAVAEGDRSEQGREAAEIVLGLGRNRRA
jgi:hypothetical protein